MASDDVRERPSYHQSLTSPAMAANGLSNPSYRPSSPSPSISPTPAIGACPELSRSVSEASGASVFSGRSTSLTRESLGSASSRQSSASYTSRQSSGGLERPKRRGYVRPQGTNFAASAQSRESVMSLGSIAHLQYYFARTGLLDGKGGQLAKKKTTTGTLDLSSLDTQLLSPGIDRDPAYSSMRSSPEFLTHGQEGLVESPIEEEDYDYYSEDDHPEMLPPTVSTYNFRSKPIPKPPTLEELKFNLQKALGESTRAMTEAQAAENQLHTPSPSRRRSESDVSSPETPPSASQGWYELQGMHILDVMTLAIRAAKMYYTAHDQPMLLSAIKSERKIRTELLSVMDVLKRMATRNFSHGMRPEERQTMEDWVKGVWEMLRLEEEMERRDLEEREGWLWLEDSLWPGPSPNIEREYAFLKSMDPAIDSLPECTPLDSIINDTSASPFFKSLQSGLRLVKLHNALVKRSKRPFGAIPSFHTDTAKPYRCAENLRFWIKAAELRWEVVLKVDVMGVVGGTSAEAWSGFEAALWKWCSKVREELSADLKA